MMLGAKFVPKTEVEGWIRVIAQTQPGPSGLKFAHGLTIPPYSIPDHITLNGEACWFPGAYTNQGVGDFGFLPPADDAYFYIQMIWEQAQLAKNLDFYHSKVKTGWGEVSVAESARLAFDSVEADRYTGLVVCKSEPNLTRVDWGFCDSIRKSGLCLMPSLLRFQAAQRLQKLALQAHDTILANHYQSTVKEIKGGIAGLLIQLAPNGEAFLISANELGRKEDVWGEALAVCLHALSPASERLVATHLLNQYNAGEITQEGQVRHLPKSGIYGGHWEQALSAPETYQNGGYWATATGWLIAAISTVDRKAADRLFTEYIESLHRRSASGAPFEWIQPASNSNVNGKYGSSAGWIAITLKQFGWH